MHGSEHFIAAEQLMAAIEDDSHDDPAMAVKLAHVHAMLAVAGATIDAGTRRTSNEQSLDGDVSYAEPAFIDAWRTALSDAR